jgi:phosphatidylglycerophosphate synthase
MMAAFTLRDVRERTYKERDSWWTVLLVDPLASRLVVTTANRTSITPNQLTVVGFALGVIASVLFWVASPWALVLGAACFHLSFVLDCMDGKIARLKGTGSLLGGWLDYFIDHLRILLCSVGLFGGQYRETHEVGWVWLALAVVFLDMLRYLNAMQVANIYAIMRAEVIAACESEGLDPTVLLAGVRGPGPGQGGPDLPTGAATHKPSDPVAPMAAREAIDGSRALHESAARRFGWYGSLRRAMHTRRIRLDLFSGIEFQMFVFVVAPLALAVWGGPALVTVVIASMALLVAFEVLLVYMTTLSVRDMKSLTGRIRAGGT